MWWPEEDAAELEAQLQEELAELERLREIEAQVDKLIKEGKRIANKRRVLFSLRQIPEYQGSYNGRTGEWNFLGWESSGC
jgi:transposase